MHEPYQLKRHIPDQQLGFRSQPRLPLPVGSVNMGLGPPMNQLLSKDLGYKNKQAMFLALEASVQ